MAGEKLTIESDDQGNFTCTSADEPDEKGDNQTFTSLDDVLQWVQQELSEDEGSPQDVWNQEAAKRPADPSAAPPAGMPPQ